MCVANWHGTLQYLQAVNFAESLVGGGCREREGEIAYSLQCGHARTETHPIAVRNVMLALDMD